MFARRIVPFLMASLLAFIAVGSAAAAKNVVHFTEELNETLTFPAGPEAACVGGAQMVTITAEGLLRITQFVDGPNAGTFHVRASIEGTFRFFTGDRTVASGTFRQHVNFKAHRGDERDNFVIHATGTLANGEDVKFMFHGHFTMRDGEVTREIFKVNCIK